MEDLLDDYVSREQLSMGNIRELVDDYSLISHYLGAELELRTRYSSPLREGDSNPSFSMFYGYGAGKEDKLYFKDQASGARGDVYDFLMIYLNARSMTSLFEQINFDLGLGLNGAEREQNLRPTLIKKAPIVRETPKIKIVSQKPTQEYMNYWWGKYEIGKQMTDFYQVKCVDMVQYHYSDHVKSITPKTLCIAYPIGRFYKIYCPFETKEYKFRNDYPSTYVEGHMQLDWTRSDLLVITKAMKECILFRQHWNIQAVAGKSETTNIPDFIMQQYLAHFKRVILWLDPDEAGIKSTKDYLSLYPSLEVAVVPQWITEKDPTDIYEMHRKDVTTQIVCQALKLN